MAGEQCSPDHFVGFFPTVIAWLLTGIGVLLLIRGILGRAPWMRWKVRDVFLLAALVAIVWTAATLWGARVFIFFGPSETAASVLLVLILAMACARLSRLRATGMLALGLLLSTVGIDIVTGETRFTMGFEQLLDGINLIVAATGLICVADSLVCVISPSLLLATYTRRFTRWRDLRVPTLIAVALRALAALIIGASCYLAYSISAQVWDIGLLLLFAAFGVACKLFAWNRLLMVLGLSYGPILEQSIRQAMLLSQGDPTIFFQRPISTALVIAAGAVMLVALVLSLWRALSGRSTEAAAT